jgi:hypothetical protein
MTNQERLEKYLVGTDDSYLKSGISNGKVIMLSGKWGSGKTHFWKNKIEENLKKEKIPNNYISLYGKTSIQEIKNEMFLKIFESVDSSELEEKGTKLAKNIVDLISSFIKSVHINGVKIDLSTASDSLFGHIENFLENKKLKKTVEYLNNGAIICFDDFERKSKDIDLNDLFGFITQLTLNFDCKVVIILNDDVFEGEEKKIFSNVKEKSVSKFLKYEPSIKDLFETIFEDSKYRILDNHKEIILKTIEETEELNARIYIQVLDNLVEWIGNKQEIGNDILRCLILVNINFILYHTILDRQYKSKNRNEYEPFVTHTIQKLLNVGFEYLQNNSVGQGIIEEVNSFDKYIIKLINKITISKEISDEKIRIRKQFIENNIILFKSDYFANKLDISKNVDDKNFNKINNFIESGILINE